MSLFCTGYAEHSYTECHYSESHFTEDCYMALGAMTLNMTTLFIKEKNCSAELIVYLNEKFNYLKIIFKY